jgi:hypothetical protein
MRCLTHHFGVAGDIVDVCQVVADEATWDASSQSADPSWSVRRVDGKVFASRLTYPESMTVADDPTAWLDQVRSKATVPDSPADARCAMAKRRRRKKN